MKEVKEYIESGILELYVMGDLSPEEKLEVEAMILKFPEIKAELEEIETGLEGYAATYAVDPGDHMRTRIVEGLSAGPELTKPMEASVVSIPSAKTNNSFYKYAFAACLALLVMSVAGLFVLYNRLQNSQQQVAILQTSTQQFSNRVNYMNRELESSRLALGVLRNPAVKIIRLAGTKQAPQASMVVAFNPAQKEVMIDMSAMKMPANDADHQYQLWAMVDGKPVDLGVFDMTEDSEGMKKMKALGSAEAFAVTLEPRGGSVNPTMEQMMVLGSI